MKKLIDTEHKLTKDFFHLVANKQKRNIKPILQILKSRPFLNGNGMHLRLSDGEYHYSFVVLIDKGFEIFKSNSLEKKNSIIKIINYKITNRIFDNSVKRIQLIISEIEILCKENPLIGEPKWHSGNFLDYQDVYNDILPIIAINPLDYWKICGRVTIKMKLREFENSGGRSKIFSFIVVDDKGTEIKLSCFGDRAVIFNDFIQVSKTYLIKGNRKSIKSAKKEFNTTGHEYEIYITDDTEIFEYDKVIEPPILKINHVLLSNINSKIGEFIDIVAVLVTMSNTINSKTKNGILLNKDIYLSDQSMAHFLVKIWSDHCYDFTDDMVGKPIILKNVFVKKAEKGCYLSYCMESSIVPFGDIKIPENILNLSNNNLYNYENLQYLPLKIPWGILPNLTINAAIARAEKYDGENGMYFNVFGTISKFGDDVLYQSCTQKDCNKKVIYKDDYYYCEKCNNSSDTCEYFFAIRLEIYDHSGSLALTIFGDKAEALLNKSASEVYNIKREDDSIDIFDITRDMIDKRFNFYIQCKKCHFRESKALSWVICDFQPANPSIEAENLRLIYEDVKKHCSNGNKKFAI